MSFWQLICVVHFSSFMPQKKNQGRHEKVKTWSVKGNVVLDGDGNAHLLLVQSFVICS